MESKRALPIGLTLLVGLGLMLPAQLATARRRPARTAGGVGSRAEEALELLLATDRSGGGDVKGVAVLAFEGTENPDCGAIDSNPFGVLASGKWTYVADAGANALLRVNRKGQIQTVSVFPDRSST